MIASLVACTPDGASYTNNLLDSPAISFPDSLAGLSCSMASSDSPESCTASLQLAKAKLSFYASQRFKLVAEYQACYQRESITANGSYRRVAANSNGQQLELQADLIEGSNFAASKAHQTLGTLQLHANGSQGRYTDNRAWQKIPSYSEAPPPVAEFNCERRL